MNTIREIEKINNEELERGIAGTSASWHTKYSNSAWVYIGNIDHELSEGDIICVMSQYGEVEDIHLAREEDTGKSRGFAFLKYEDARSCVLAVDNFVGVQILGRSLRIDHVEKYRLPKNVLEAEDEKGAPILDAGHAYKDAELKNDFNIHQGQDLFAPVDQRKEESSESSSSSEKRRRKRKDKHKKRKESRRKHEDKKGRKRERRDKDDVDDSDRRVRRRKHSKSDKERRHRHGDRSASKSEENKD